MIKLKYQKLSFEIIHLRPAKMEELLRGSASNGPLSPASNNGKPKESIWKVYLKDTAGNDWDGYFGPADNLLGYVKTQILRGRCVRDIQVPELRVTQWKKEHHNQIGEVFLLEEGIAWFEFGIFNMNMQKSCTSNHSK